MKPPLSLDCCEGELLGQLIPSPPDGSLGLQASSAALCM